MDTVFPESSLLQNSSDAETRQMDRPAILENRKIHPDFRRIFMYGCYPNLSKGNGQMIRIAAGIFVGGAVFYVMTTYLTGFSWDGIIMAGFFGVVFGSVVAFADPQIRQGRTNRKFSDDPHDDLPFQNGHHGYVNRTQWFNDQ